MFKRKNEEEIKMLIGYGIFQWAVIIIAELVYLFSNI